MGGTDSNDGSPVGRTLPEEVLARRAALPRKPSAVTLEGRLVRLEPLDLARHAAGLQAVSDGRALTVGDRSTGAYDPEALIWRYLSGGPFSTATDLAAWLRPQVEAADVLPFCVLDAAGGHPLGVATYMNNVPEHLKVELGSIWYGPVAQRTGANTEATWLLLEHAFGLGYRRAEWKCDALNARSRASALRMGFTFEGIQDAHLIIRGRNRDTAWFRILDEEWPRVRAGLRDLLARA